MTVVSVDANDVADMTAEAVRGGTDNLVRWLARRLQAGVGLLGPTGTWRRWHMAGGPGRAVLTKDIIRPADDLPADVTAGPGWTAHITEAGPGHSLVVVAGDDQPAGEIGTELIRQAGRLASLCLADETILQLRYTIVRYLMQGNADAARAAAHGAGIILPATVCLVILEGPSDQRDKAAAAMESAGAAWAIRCPGHPQTVFLASAEDDKNAAGLCDGLLSRIRVLTPDCASGSSGPVPLAETAIGYAAAVDALAIARGARERFDTIDRAQGLGLLNALGPDARVWAAMYLGPLLDYKPPRPHDPAGWAISSTLMAWLDYGGAGAARKLRYHRNTISSRVHHAEELLGTDFSDPGERAAVRLASRILYKREAMPETGSPPPLSQLLAAPAVQQWAEVTLRPLVTDPDQRLLPAIQAWLAAGRQVTDQAARTAGVTPGGMRHRVARAERLLRRSLTGKEEPAPHDLYLALVACGYAESPGGRAENPLARPSTPVSLAS